MRFILIMEAGRASTGCWKRSAANLREVRVEGSWSRGWLYSAHEIKSGESGREAIEGMVEALHKHN